MNGQAVKEMNSVPHLMSLHPMCTMLGADRLVLTDNVCITKEERLAWHTWMKINDEKIGQVRLSKMFDNVRALQKGASEIKCA